MLKSFDPIESPQSRILILGTMPGTASLAMGQYYAHGRNHFWPVISTLLEFPQGADYKAGCELFVQSGAALWDVLHSCLRDGSLDSNIEAEQPNDIGEFIREHKYLKAVFFNGANAEKFFRKYITPQLPDVEGIHFERLPSTSPANASMSFEQKLEIWRRILEFL